MSLGLGVDPGIRDLWLAGLVHMSEIPTRHPEPHLFGARSPQKRD
jgi:hypothetical protein